MALRTLLQPLRAVLLQQGPQISEPIQPAVFWGCNQLRIRYKRKNNKHWLVKWKGFRRLKMLKVTLPDMEVRESNKTLTPEEIRIKMKEKGVAPGRPWMERPFEISSTGDTFEPYFPPEGDGKASFVSKEGAKQSAEMMSKKSKTWFAFRKIRQFDEDFTDKQFVREFEKIYLNVHKPVAAQDKDLLRTLVTERAYPDIYIMHKTHSFSESSHDTKLKTSGNSDTKPDSPPEGKPNEDVLLAIHNTLTDSLSHLFVKPMNYKIYDPNMVFIDNIRDKRTKGLYPYIQQVALLRTVGHLKFAYVKFVVLNTDISKEEGRITVRWRIVGVTGLQVFLQFWKFKLWDWKGMMDRQGKWMDGVSYYDVGADGLIFRHIADKMMIDKDKEVVTAKIPPKGVLAAGMMATLLPESILVSFNKSKDNV